MGIYDHKLKNENQCFCPGCSGSGKRPCTECHTGRDDPDGTCWKCDGTGLETCFECDGSGVLD